MAITATLNTSYGESRQLYVRLNNCEASNHGVPATALFRGYISVEACSAGKRYVWEREISFTPDVSGSLWDQAYAALKAIPVQELPAEPQAPTPLADDASDDDKTSHATAQAQYDALHADWEGRAAEIEAENAEVMALASSHDA